MRDTPCCLFFWINYCIEAERKQVRFARIMGSFKRTSQWKPFQQILGRPVLQSYFWASESCLFMFVITCLPNYFFYSSFQISRWRLRERTFTAEGFCNAGQKTLISAQLYAGTKAYLFSILTLYKHILVGEKGLFHLSSHFK